MMAEPILTQIVKAVNQRLKTITKTNGYQTSAGSNVYAFREHAVPETSLPAIVYSYQEGDPEDETFGSVTRSVEFRVVLLTAKGGTARAQAADLFADLLKCIGMDVTWSGLAVWTTEPSAPVDAERTEKYVFGVEVAFRVLYETNYHDAYGL